MKWLMTLLLGLTSAQYLADLEMVTLSFKAEAFRESFNAAQDRPRLVGVFSPRCGHCLQAVSEVADILKRHPQSRIQVYILWSPFMHVDNKAAAQAATQYIPDSRVKHFWDLWRFASRLYTEQLGLPPEHAWDMWTFYKPQLAWTGETPPPPTFWMQNRALDIGEPYSKEALEKKLEAWF